MPSPAGPIWGCLIPLGLLAIGRRNAAAQRYLCFFAGLCLIANGAYIGIGWVDAAGDAGTQLAPEIKTSINGMTFHGVTVASGETRHEFGYTLLNRVAGGWSVELKAAAGRTLVTCRIKGNHLVFSK